MKILFLVPANIRDGQPSFERIASFRRFYQQAGHEVVDKTMPVGLWSQIVMLWHIWRHRYPYVFLSMPPFRTWLLFAFLPKQIILDIRDGWSIAIESGYGGTEPIRPKWAKVAKRIEYWAIGRAALAITCTPGLQQHLEKISRKPLLLLPNGVSQANYETIQTIKLGSQHAHNNHQVSAICAGQFSEYGRKKAELILQKLSLVFSSKKVILSVLGADKEQNAWIDSFIEEQAIHNVECVLLDRVSHEEMYRLITQSDVAVTVIRDPDYDFGTKVFDYIACGIPVFNYFEEENNFSKYFMPFFYSSTYRPASHEQVQKLVREYILQTSKMELLSVFKQ